LEDWGLAPNRYVLYLGRLSPEKNCHLLIEAFKRLRTEMKLVLAGGSNQADSYTRQLLREQSDQIIFLPWQKGVELDELLTTAALFVLPSDIEGLSLALLDAMAAGTCVLTSDIPENKELVEGVGFTFHRGDPHDLERMLDILLRDPAMRRRAARLAFQRIEESYRWPGIAKSVEEVYYTVLGWPPTGIKAPEINLSPAIAREVTAVHDHGFFPRL
jgi:glycosyltransferase involved in cell wall biosynthesis